MRRRPPTVVTSAPPAELECYPLWCEQHGRRAFAIGDLALMREAARSFRDWEAARDRWKATHPGQRLKWVGDWDAPFDRDLI